MDVHPQFTRNCRVLQRNLQIQILYRRDPPFLPLGMLIWERFAVVAAWLQSLLGHELEPNTQDAILERHLAQRGWKWGDHVAVLDVATAGGARGPYRPNPLGHHSRAINSFQMTKL
jgi:hypothetical protein